MQTKAAEDLKARDEIRLKGEEEYRDFVVWDVYPDEHVVRVAVMTHWVSLPQEIVLPRYHSVWVTKESL